MTPARALAIALLALTLLIGAQPGAEAQFPRGLLAGLDPKVGQGRICTIETRPLSFTAYDPLAGTPVDAIAEIIYTCATGNGSGGGGGGGGRGGGAPPGRGGGGGGGGGGNGNGGIRIEMAQGYSGSFAPRDMVGPGFTNLEYNIYLDAQHRTVWGTGEGTTQYYVDSNPPNGTPVIVPAFGRIFGRQEVLPGPYTDNVPVRILF